MAGDNKFGKFTGYLVVLVIILLAAFLVFNENGLLKYLSLKNQVQALQVRIDSAQLKIDKMHAQIDSLKTDMIKIEKVAREKFLMRFPNEKLIQIKEK